jgi:hypothetical protein
MRGDHRSARLMRMAFSDVSYVSVFLLFRQIIGPDLRDLRGKYGHLRQASQ